MNLTQPSSPEGTFTLLYIYVVTESLGRLTSPVSTNIASLHTCLLATEPFPQESLPSNGILSDTIPRHWHNPWPVLLASPALTTCFTYIRKVVVQRSSLPCTVQYSTGQALSVQYSLSCMELWWCLWHTGLPSVCWSLCSRLHYSQTQVLAGFINNSSNCFTTYMLNIL